MDKKITNILDNLTTEQTDELLDENMNIKISDKDRKRIKNAVYEKIGSKKRKWIYMPKKLVACMAVFAVIFTSLYIVGFDTVAAAIKNLFTFTPGVGITEKSDNTIYTINPITRQTKSQDAKANIVSAVYADEYLTVTVEVVGREVHSDGFTIYDKQNVLKLDDVSQNGYGLCVSSDSTMLTFSLETSTPKEDDIYEIAITGFSQHLSFKMTPCRDYEDIKEIGPTDIQNGISITTTAQKIDGQLIVWCYPFNVSNKSDDNIIGIGNTANGSFDVAKYIETDNGKIFDNHSGWNINGRMRFDIPENNNTAVLHIPYLSMLREEKKQLTISLPKDYTTLESDDSIKCSLGTIRVTEIERTSNEYEHDKDTVFIKFAFDSNDNNMKLYSFDFETAGKYLSNAKHFNSETGQLDFLEVYVDKDDKKVSLNISDLYYYMFGEYVIPLDIE